MRNRVSLSAGLAIGTLGFLISVAFAVVSSLVVARIYGISVVGQFALVSAPVNAAWYLSSVREQPAMVRRLTALPARDPRATATFITVLAFSTLLTIVVTGVSGLASFFVFRYSLHQPQLVAPAIVGLLVFLAATNPAWNAESVLTAFGAARTLFWVRLNQLIAALAASIVFSYYSHSVWSLVAANGVSWFVALVHRAFSLHRWLIFPISLQDLRTAARELPDILRFGLKAAPGAIADGVGTESPTWVIGILSTNAAVGAYSRAWLIAQRLVSVSFRISEMLFPALVDRSRRADFHSFDRGLVDTMRYTVLGMLLPAAAVGGASEGVTRLFGPGFQTGGWALAILMLVPVAATLLGVQSHAFFAVGRPLEPTKFALLGMAFKLLGVGLLTPAYGITGAALGLLIGFSVQLALQTSRVRDTLSQPLLRLWPAAHVAGVVAGYLLAFIAARVVTDATRSVLGTLLGLSCGSGVYLLSIALLVRPTAVDLQRIRGIRGRGGLAVTRLRNSGRRGV